MGKVQALSNAMSRSPKNADMVEALTGSTFLNPTVTRWCSEFYAVELVVAIGVEKVNECLTSTAILARHTERNLHHFLISWIDTCHRPPHQSTAFVTTLCWWTLSSRRTQHFPVLQLLSVCSVQLVKFWPPAVVVFLMSTLTLWSSWETALRSQVNNFWTLMYWPLTFGWCTVQ